MMSFIYVLLEVVAGHPGKCGGGIWKYGTGGERADVMRKMISLTFEWGSQGQKWKNHSSIFPASLTSLCHQKCLNEFLIFLSREY